MRAVVIDRFGERPRVAAVPEPGCTGDGVVIRVEAAGLCRSDWHAWAGHDASVRLPLVPGHEFVGVIEHVGPDVRRFVPGDRVTTPFVLACGACPECDSGNGQVCRNQTQPGFTGPGAFAELVAVRHADVNLVRVPAGVEAGAAAILGCRFATAYRGLVHRAGLASGETLLVVGCGGVGLSAVMIGAARGATVIGVDVDRDALALAARFGAARAVNTSELDTADVDAAIRTAVPDGADVSVDAVGSEATAGAALRGLRRRGRHVQIGLFAEAPRIPMPDVIAGELSVLGSHGMPAADYPDLVADVVSGRLPSGRLVTRQIALDDVPEALTSMGRSPGVTLVRPAS